jgi:hypothetical protein
MAKKKDYKDTRSPNLICDSCRKAKPDVCTRANHYQRDVNNDSDATWVACDDCDYENRMDI